MKRLFIIVIAVILLVSGAYVFMAKQSGSALPEPEPSGNVRAPAAASFNPADVSVAVASAETQAGSAELLMRRLHDIGFSASVVPADPEQQGADYLTVFYRPSVADRLDAILATFARAAVTRRFAIDSLSQDIVLAAWAVDDIKWGDLEAEAQPFLHPDPATVSVLVLNAGAPLGAAGTVASLLRDKGYAKAEGKNSDADIVGSPVIYYQRNFKGVAKLLLPMLRSNGYADTTYRARMVQDASIVIVLTRPEAAGQ